MFSMLKEWRNYNANLSLYKAHLKEFNKESPPEDDNQAMDWIKRSDDLEEWRRLIITRYLQAQADILGVNLPDFNEPEMYRQVAWDDDPAEPYYFTNGGFQVARERIRAEKKHRRDVAGFWIASSVGVIGALTGLVSAFK